MLSYIRMKTSYPQLAGMRFGQLEAIEYVRPGFGKGGAFWTFLCDCGGTIEAKVINVTSRKVVNCGCVKVKRTQTIKTITQDYDFLVSTHPLYNTWLSMLARCENPENSRYSSYGGRGITVHPDWQNFANFIRDMGVKPTSTHSLDRINNDGNYEPSNCRWATPKEQSNNRRPQQ